MFDVFIGMGFVVGYRFTGLKGIVLGVATYNAFIGTRG